jgi:hypothetical protein
MTTTNPPHDAAWDSIRARYEQGEEKVVDIARAAGMTMLGLSLHAKANGWTLRSVKRVKAVLKKAKTRGTAKLLKPETTQDTLRRLKDLLQSRIAKLEREIASIGEDIDALANERQIRSVNTVVRTLEKVLDLERKDRAGKRKTSKEFKHFDDAERLALAQKIERIEAERDSTMAEPQAGDTGHQGVESPVVVLDAARSATAAAP